MHRAAGLAVGVRRSSSRQELHHHARRPSWQGQHPARRRLPLRYWRWLAPLCVVTFGEWPARCSSAAAAAALVLSAPACGLTPLAACRAPPACWARLLVFQHRLPHTPLLIYCLSLSPACRPPAPPTAVGWVKFVRHLAAIPNSQWELPAAVLKPHSPSAWCDARLSAVLPATTLGGAEGGSQPGAAVAGGGWAAGVAGVQSPEAAYTSMRRKLYQALDDSLASQGLRLGELGAVDSKRRIQGANRFSPHSHTV